MVVQVIVAVPAATPVTVPLLTDALSLALDVQETLLSVALAGVTVGVIVNVSPTRIALLVGSTVTPVTFTVAETTVNACSASCAQYSVPNTVFAF